MQVAIFDQSNVLAERLRELITDAQACAISNAYTYQSAIHMLAQSCPDVVLVDGDFLDSGLSAFVKKIRLFNKAAVVVLMLGPAVNRDMKIYASWGIDYVIDKFDDFLMVPCIIINTKNQLSAN